MYSWSLIFRKKVTCLPISWFLFQLFIVNAFFFCSLAVVFFFSLVLVPILKSVFKINEGVANKLVILYYNLTFWSLISNWWVTCMPTSWFLFWLIIVRTLTVFFLVFYWWHMCAHPYPKMVQNRRRSSQKMVIFCYKLTFWSLVFIWKITSVPITTFIFSLFKVYLFFFGYVVVEYVTLSHPSVGSKWTN